MTHWRKPVDPTDAARFIEYLNGPDRIPGYLYIPGMVLLVSVVIVGVAYLFGGWA